MPPWVADAHFLDPQLSINVLALEDERDQRSLVLELDVAHHAARAEAPRVFRRLQFVRRSFRDEQDPEQVLASLACGSPETRERAIRMVHEHRADHASEREAMTSIAA